MIPIALLSPDLRHRQAHKSLTYGPTAVATKREALSRCHYLHFDADSNSVHISSQIGNCLLTVKYLGVYVLGVR